LEDLLESFLEEFGYIALMVGTFLEGETAILIASSLIHQGFFAALPTVVAGFAGSFVSDWLYYLIGRINGRYFVDKRPKLKSRLEPVRLLFEKNRLPILLSYRFLYGFRAIIPIVIGMSGVKPMHFLFFSVASGLVWASIVSTAGFLAGKYFNIQASLFEENIVLILIAFATLGMVMGYGIKQIVGRSVLANPVTVKK
jgi:membrane protein DedA with SNARE-associated domain